MRQVTRIVLSGLVGLAMTLFAGCSDDEATNPATDTIYRVVVNHEEFRIALRMPEQIAAAEAMLASGKESVIHGHLARGDGGFNKGYRWHMMPETVTFPDMAMEVCDGRPRSDVESDIPYWVDNIKYYCPWGAQVVGRG